MDKPEITKLLTHTSFEKEEDDNSRFLYNETDSERQ